MMGTTSSTPEFFLARTHVEASLRDGLITVQYSVDFMELWETIGNLLG